MLRGRYTAYWNRPVPGFGARLYGELERLGLWDGRVLRGAYILNAVKCVPPKTRPTGAEQAACRPWLRDELAALSTARVVLALGAIAQRAVLRCYGTRPLARHPFAHGALHRIDGRPPLLSSYHPSRQNTNTGVLTRRMWRAILRRALRLSES